MSRRAGIGSARRTLPVLILLLAYRADEAEHLCRRLSPGLARLGELPGGHHFGGDYQGLADRVLSEAGR